MAACFTAPSFILTCRAPCVWPSAAADWMRAALTEAEQVGASDISIELNPPLRNAVTGDAASFAAPATMRLKVRGQWQATTLSGAVVTIALTLIDGQWLISDWAWTIGGGEATMRRNRRAPRGRASKPIRTDRDASVCRHTRAR